MEKLFNGMLKKYGTGGLLIVIGLVLTSQDHLEIGVFFLAIGITLIIIYQIYIYHTKKSTFKKAIAEILRLLRENENYYRGYGPNSSAGDFRDIRLDVTLWENAKKDVIIPNNRRILELLKEFQSDFHSSELAIVQKMEAHIYGFEKNNTQGTKVDYSEHLFPRVFSNLIYSKIYTNNPEELTAEFKKWFIENVCDKYDIFERIYIFGSAIFEDEAKDVDALMLYKGAPADFVPLYGQITREFENFFSIPLHITAFSETNELNLFNKFLENCGEVVLCFER